MPGVVLFASAKSRPQLPVRARSPNAILTRLPLSCLGFGGSPIRKPTAGMSSEALHRRTANRANPCKARPLLFLCHYKNTAAFQMPPSAVDVDVDAGVTRASSDDAANATFSTNAGDQTCSDSPRRHGTRVRKPQRQTDDKNDRCSPAKWALGPVRAPGDGTLRCGPLRSRGWPAPPSSEQHLE